MDTEWEATFWPVTKDDMRARLKKAGAELAHEERLMRRYVLHMPNGGSAITHDRVRVRDEGDKVTMTIKQTGEAIHEQKEYEIVIDDLERGKEFLEHLGCAPMAYQETKRESWKLLGTSVTIDEWPHIEPWLEIEGANESSVRGAAEALGLLWSDAKFCTKKALYGERYGISRDEAGTIMAHLVFNEPNPFEKTSGK